MDTSSDQRTSLASGANAHDFCLQEDSAMLAEALPTVPSSGRDDDEPPIDVTRTWRCPSSHQTRKACLLPSGPHAGAGFCVLILQATSTHSEHSVGLQTLN